MINVPQNLLESKLESTLGDVATCKSHHLLLLGMPLGERIVKSGL